MCSERYNEGVEVILVDEDPSKEPRADSGK